ncbi:MAG: TOBE domain-containing protein, partial [Pseudomonadota bacterium]
TDGGLRYGDTLIPVPAPDDAVRLGIRPEHIDVAAPGAGLFDARIDVKEALGGESYLYARTPAGERIVVKTDGDDATDHGDTVGILMPPERVHLFGADGTNLAAAG